MVMDDGGVIIVGWPGSLKFTLNNPAEIIDKGLYQDLRYLHDFSEIALPCFHVHGLK